MRRLFDFAYGFSALTKRSLTDFLPVGPPCSKAPAGAQGGVVYQKLHVGFPRDPYGVGGYKIVAFNCPTRKRGTEPGIPNQITCTLFSQVPGSHENIRVLVP